MTSQRSPSTPTPLVVRKNGNIIYVERFPLTRMRKSDIFFKEMYMPHMRIAGQDEQKSLCQNDIKKKKMESLFCLFIY